MAKEILQRTFNLFAAVHVTALHAVLQRFGSEIDHDGFIGSHGHPVGKGFADGDAGDVADGGRNAFDMLNVESGQHIDFSG